VRCGSLNILKIARSGIILAVFYLGCSETTEQFILPSPPNPGPRGWETPPLLSAQALLPPELRKGPHHEAQNGVVNDGAQNHFVITSEFGEFGQFHASSEPLVRVRVNEIEAIALIKEASRSKVFMDAAKYQATYPFKGMKLVFTEPAQAASHAGGALLEYLSFPGRTVKAEWSDAEDNWSKDMIGFSYLKRRLAFQFGVDPYSSNQILQDELNNLAWIAFIGDIGPQIGTYFIPSGVISFAVTSSQWTTVLQEQVRDQSPGDLRAMNRARLAEIGISETDIHEFFRNPLYSPRHQTVISAALQDMDDVADRSKFLKDASEANSEEAVLFYQYVAEMMRGYHRHVGRADRLIALPKIPALYTTDRRLVVLLPVDHVFWTSRVAGVAAALTANVPRRPRVARREIWVAGNVSAHAREELESAGWAVREQVKARLFPPA